MILTIIIFILVLGLLVLVHEAGHFLAARRFGVKAEEFGFGFPPRMFGFYKKTNGKWKLVWGDKTINPSDVPGTIYSLNWIPLGGFVKIKGENGETTEKDSFASKPAWQRSIMLVAGVVMNIALAWVIITIGLMFGLPQVLDNLPKDAKITGRQIQIVDVIADSPALKAEFKVGDFIEDINDQKFNTYKEVQDFVADHNGQALTYTIKRGQTMIDKQVTPVTMKETNRGGIGIGIAEIGLVRYPFFTAIAKGFMTTFSLFWMIVVGLFGLLARLFTGHNVSAEVAGPVGIATMTGQMVDMGWVYLMQFVALLSLNLAVINILPIPALDGGRLVFLGIEKLRRGKQVKQTTEAMIHNIFFILLLLLILFITYKDVAKLGCLTCKLGSWLKL